MRLTINCDMGEGFGLYRIGDDAAMMPHIDLANVACGFHASDPPTDACNGAPCQSSIPSRLGRIRRYRISRASVAGPW
jgi:hypothetical protein